MLTVGEGGRGSLKKMGRGNNMHPVLECLSPQPMCISSLNLEKSAKIRNRKFPRYLILSNTNAPLSTYNTKNDTNKVPKVKDYGL